MFLTLCLPPLSLIHFCCEPLTASSWPKHNSYLSAKASRATLHYSIGSCGCYAQLWLIWYVRGLHPCSYLGIDCFVIVHANHSFFLSLQKTKKKRKEKLVEKKGEKKREKRNLLKPEKGDK